MDEEWRVSLVNCVRLADGKPVSPGTVRGLLDSRVSREVSVTAGRRGAFLYAATADAAAAAEGTAREVLLQRGLAADIRSERWDPSRQAWLPPGDTTAAELPSQQERGPGRKRLRTAGAVIAAIIDGIGNAGSLTLAGHAGSPSPGNRKTVRQPQESPSAMQGDGSPVSRVAEDRKKGAPKAALERPNCAVTALDRPDGVSPQVSDLEGGEPACRPGSVPRADARRRSSI